MTQVAAPPPAAAGEERPVPEGHVRLTIDGITVDAPKNELVIRTAERIGIAIPRFCDHPLLEPVGACRQCLVEVELGGRPMPKPQAACTQAVADGMVVHTQLTSPVAEKAQRGNLEFLLLNHPLDCPICDKGGECPLQNQVLEYGDPESRLNDDKRVFVKPIPISTEILLDRERCVLCQRCTRFSDQIAGDKFIDLLERGSAQQIGINSEQPFSSYFSGNTIQICPVGALTSAAYRFRSRPFDLVSTETVCEHCASGCSLRTDHRSGVVMRRLAGADPAVNEEWNCDKGRFAFGYLRQGDRLTRPLVRGESGELEPASWTDAIAAAAAGLAKARDNGGVGVLPGGRLTLTDAYAYAKFARLALRTNDIDFRAREHSAEEESFLASRVRGVTPDTGGVTYADLELTRTVLLVALEPEEESPILFLRLRKASRGGLRVIAVTPWGTRGLSKLSATVLPVPPGDEIEVIRGLPSGEFGQALRDAVILVGERAAQVPGLLTAVGELSDATGSRIGWVPRRAGDRGALEAGALPSLLPGGYPVADPVAREAVEKAWGARVPAAPGRDLDGILAAVGPELDERGQPVEGAEPGLAGLLIGGVDLNDLPDPAAAFAAVAAAGFVVSLEIRATAVTELADVVFPVAAAPERSGAYLNWEGRYRPFDAAVGRPGQLDDGRVLDTLGVEMDVDLYTQTPVAARADLGRLGSWTGSPATARAHEVDDWRTTSHKTAEFVRADVVDPRSGGLQLASWRLALDGGSLLDGEPHLAGTARPEVAVLDHEEAAAAGLVPGAEVTVSGPAGSLSLPWVAVPMPSETIWLPGRVDGASLFARLGARVGDRVQISPAVTGQEA